MSGEMKPPTVQMAIPSAVAVDRTGVGKSSAATRNTADIFISPSIGNFYHSVLLPTSDSYVTGKIIILSTY